MPTWFVHLPLPPDEAPQPDRIHGDRSPVDRYRREFEEQRRAGQEMLAMESPEERDARVYKIWVNYDGLTYTSDRITIVDVAAEEDEGGHTVDCPCWRHCVLRHYERMQDHG